MIAALAKWNEIKEQVMENKEWGWAKTDFTMSPRQALVDLICKEKRSSKVFISWTLMESKRFKAHAEKNFTKAHLTAETEKITAMGSQITKLENMLNAMTDCHEGMKKEI